MELDNLGIPPIIHCVSDFNKDGIISGSLVDGSSGSIGANRKDDLGQYVIFFWQVEKLAAYGFKYRHI